MVLCCLMNTAGKGDKLRKGANLPAYWNNYDAIFGKKDQQCKLNEEHTQQEQPPTREQQDK